MIRAFPGLRRTVDHILADGDLLVARVRITGTHLGQLDSLAPTGTGYTSIGAYHGRLKGGKIIEDWDVWTVLPLYQQKIMRLRS